MLLILFVHLLKRILKTRVVSAGMWWIHWTGVFYRSIYTLPCVSEKYLTWWMIILELTTCMAASHDWLRFQCVSFSWSVFSIQWTSLQQRCGPTFVIQKKNNPKLISVTPVFRMISFVKYDILIQLYWISDRLSEGLNISHDTGKSCFLASIQLQIKSPYCVIIFSLTPPIICSYIVLWLKKKINIALFWECSLCNTSLSAFVFFSVPNYFTSFLD